AEGHSMRLRLRSDRDFRRRPGAGRSGPRQRGPRHQAIGRSAPGVGSPSSRAGNPDQARDV
ncbi:MAG: hypothetical protein AVDCRST_MAG10-2604, partial [uncultured Acidimicrobiales bacterium]